MDRRSWNKYNLLSVLWDEKPIGILMRFGEEQGYLFYYLPRLPEGFRPLAEFPETKGPSIPVCEGVDLQQGKEYPAKYLHATFRNRVPHIEREDTPEALAEYGMSIPFDEMEWLAKSGGRQHGSKLSLKLLEL